MTSEWRSADRLGRWAEARRPLVVDRLGREDLVPSTYSRARDLVPWPDRKVPDGLVRTTDGVGTIGPRTIASKRAQEAYALRAELGQRAYDFCQGKVAEGPKAKVVSRKAKPSAEALSQEAKAVPTKGVVLLGSELARALGIKPIGNVE